MLIAAKIGATAETIGGMWWCGRNCSVWEDAVETKCERSPERKEKFHQMRYQQSEVQEHTRVQKSASHLSIGSSGLSEHARNFYRSINVCVPHPLPSLRDLMKSNKHGKR